MNQILTVPHEEIQKKLENSKIFKPEEKKFLLDIWGKMDQEEKNKLFEILQEEQEEDQKMQDIKPEKINEIFANFMAQIKSIHWSVKKEMMVISETKNQKIEDKILIEIESEIDNL